MARITRVASTQVRYPTLPVLDADGNPVKVPVIDKRTGQQKTTKSGRPVFMARTRADRTAEPLPNHRCDAQPCYAASREILPGTAHKHISPKSGPYGGRTLYRHASCPDWHVWEYSSSLSAQLARVSYEFGIALSGAESEDDARAALEEAAGAVREIAEAKREAAQNIVDGFGHATFASDELNETADALDGWADEIDAADVPTLEEPTDEEAGEAREDGESAEDARERLATEKRDEWRDSLYDALAIVDESPV